MGKQYCTQLWGKIDEYVREPETIMVESPKKISQIHGQRNTMKIELRTVTEIEKSV